MSVVIREKMLISGECCGLSYWIQTFDGVVVRFETIL